MAFCRRLFVILIVLLTSPLSILCLWADDDDARPLVKVLPFSVDGMESSEARMIETLFLSYLDALDDIDVIGPEPAAQDPESAEGAAGGSAEGAAPQDSVGHSLDAHRPGGGPEGGPEGTDHVVLPEPVVPDRQSDFVISGKLTGAGDGDTLSLTVKKTGSNEAVTFSSTHKTSAELALKMRSIVQTLYFAGSAEARPMDSLEISPRSLVGLWRVSKNAGNMAVQMVHFRTDGSAIAFFSSGDRMDLRFSIEDRLLVLSQAGANNERYYSGIPAPLLAQFTREAEPLVYELYLFDDGTTLRGQRTASEAMVENGEFLLILNGVKRPAELKRLGR